MGWGLTEHIRYLLFYRARWAWFYHFLFLEYNQPTVSGSVKVRLPLSCHPTGSQLQGQLFPNSRKMAEPESPFGFPHPHHCTALRTVGSSWQAEGDAHGLTVCFSALQRRLGHASYSVHASVAGSQPRCI